MAERKPPSGAKLTKPIQVTGEGEENSTSVFLEDLSQLKPSVGFKYSERGGVHIGTIKCEAHNLPKEYLSSECLEFQVAFCENDLKRSISEHDMFSAKNSYLFRVPFDPDTKTLEEKVKLGMCRLKGTEKIEERRRKHKLLHGVAEVKEHYEVGDGHVVVPFVRLINIHTKKDVCPVLYLPPIYDSNVYVTPIVKDCQVEKESSTLVFHLKTSAKTIGYVVLKNKLKELERIQIPAKTFLDKKVEVSYNSEALRVCTDVYASLITVNGLISKPATKLWFNGQRLQKPGNTAPVTMAVPQQVSHTTAVSTHPVEVNEVEVDVEEGDLEADGTRTNAMAVHSEDVKDSWTTGDGVVTHGVHSNQDSGASDANIVSIAIAEAGIADDLKNCALYEKPVSSDPSLTEEINPRLCAVSTNPVDEDDGQLSLSGSAEEVKGEGPIESEDTGEAYDGREAEQGGVLSEDEDVPYRKKTSPNVMLFDSSRSDDMSEEFRELDEAAATQQTVCTVNAPLKTDGEVGDQHPTQVEDAQETKYEPSDTQIAMASDEAGEGESFSCDSEGMQVSNLPTGFKNQLIPLAGSTLHSDPLLSQGSLAKLSLPLSPGLHHDIVWRNENCTNLPPGEELKQYGLTEATNDVDVTNEHPVSGNYTQQEVPSSMLDGSPAGQSLESGYLEDEFLDHPAYSEIIQKVSAGGVMMDEIYDGLEGFLDLDDDADTPNAAVETYGEGVEIWSDAEFVDQILDIEQEYGLAGESSESEAGLFAGNSMDCGQDISIAEVQVAPDPSKGFSNNIHVSSGAFVISNNQNDVNYTNGGTGRRGDASLNAFSAPSNSSGRDASKFCIYPSGESIQMGPEQQVSNLPTGFKNRLILLAGSTLHSDPLPSRESLAKLSWPFSLGLCHDIVGRNENCTNLSPGKLEQHTEHTDGSQHDIKTKPVAEPLFRRAAEKRQSFSPAPSGSSRGCKERMVSCAEPPKLVPVTVEFASSPKATGGGGDFLDESSPESFPPDTTLRVLAGLASPPVTTRQLAQGDKNRKKKSS